MGIVDITYGPIESVFLAVTDERFCSGINLEAIVVTVKQIPSIGIQVYPPTILKYTEGLATVRWPPLVDSTIYICVTHSSPDIPPPLVALDQPRLSPTLGLLYHLPLPECRFRKHYCVVERGKVLVIACS
jgi:hypothetical protein